LRFTLSSVPVLLALLLSGCAGFHENTPPAPHAAPAAHVAKAPPTTAGQEVALRALMLVKEGYRYGGKTLRTGLDCSGMVSYVYKAATGRTLAAGTAGLARMGRPVARNELREGDLVFFNTRHHAHSHVGIYVGNGEFVNALNEKVGVRVDHLGAPYFASRFDGARRLLT
jgi:cell wall-associated NlpC family hydrolase